jgi:hypothetical protein
MLGYPGPVGTWHGALLVALGGVAFAAIDPRRLEDLGHGSERPATSRTEEDPRALNAEIRELEEEILALGGDPYGGRWADDDRAHLSLEEHIAAIEKELDDDDDH